MKQKEHIITSIVPGSIAEEMEIEIGDILLRVNDKEIKDVLDYHFAVNDEHLILLIKKANEEEWELEIDKAYEDDIGIEFAEGLMDTYQSCKNKCMFCFIDQMPPGMRETLYFKDDDARLSFLQGNYITLTNMTDEDIDRIIYYKLSPINISIHTTDKKLRCKMLNNRFAGDSLDKVKRLFDAGITMNGQIVLCKGINDGEELEKSIHDLAAYLPHMESLSIVPVGITKYRDNLVKLEKFEKEDALEVLTIIHSWQDILFKAYGTRFVHASDEWYLTAGLNVPDADHYEGYLQIENGVGMVRCLMNEFKDYFKTLSSDNRTKSLSIATGELAAPFITDFASQICSKFPNISIRVYTIFNKFFGTTITVAGLLTGEDIMNQLKGKELGDYLLLPKVILRDGEEVLLDDFTVIDMENTLQTVIHTVQSDGKSLIDAIIN